jgi:DNA polymerase-3 subunit epsilon
VYAIVDIETTGSYAAANGVTEVAIHVFDGEKVTEKFETLINPGQFIPRYIQAFTGISNEMVENAPSFEEAAESIYKLLSENIFIAHNVNFDYSFIKSHLLKAGFDLTTKKLCTVRLSRKIFPGFPSYSLGNLCRSLNIEVSNRHRAGGDASATVEIFRKLIENDREGFIVKSLQRNSKEQSLPPHVPKSDFDNLPWTPGVYYFHNQKGKIIYVGKARNIRSRVSSHFSNNSDGRQKQNFLKHVHSISFHSCATELMAEILESAEIKRLWPQFNQSQKHQETVYSIYRYEDQNGYLRLAIEKNKRNLSPVFSFHYLTEGHAILRKLIAEYNLCPRLCFMQTDNSSCTGMDEGTCRGACIKKEKPRSYNKRVHKAIESLQAQPSFAVIDKGLGENEQSCILVINGKFYGMGYIPGEASVYSTDDLKDYLTIYKENNYIRSLLAGYAAKNPSKIIRLSPSIEMVQ